MIDVRMVGVQHSTNTTAMDGSFTIGGQAMPQHYVLSRVDDITTIGIFDNPTLQIMPFMTGTAFATLASANGVSVSGGSLVIEIVNAQNQPIVGATVALVGSSVLYDAGDPLVWAPNSSTGANGVAWIPEVPGGVQSVTVNPNNGKQPQTLMLESFDTGSMTHKFLVFL
jgi:hypothetical protein